MAPTARMSNIIANVRYYVNSISDTGLTDAQITRFVNAAVYEIARAGYWRMETLIDLPTSATEINLIDPTLIPDIIEAYDVSWNPSVTTPSGVRCQSYREFTDRRQNSTYTSTTTVYFYLFNGILRFWPEQTAEITDGLIVWHSYNVDEIDIGAVPTDPPLPSDFDRALEYYAAKMVFYSAVDRKLRESMIAIMDAEWKPLKRDLLAKGAGNDVYFNWSR